jgi:uncharacterized membrane protein YfcA
MDYLAGLSPAALALSLALALFAGVVKGVAGFAMPLILMSGLSAFLPPHLALAGLILPTLVTNVSQALRQGWTPARETARTYRRFLIATMVCIPISAPFASALPERVFLVALGLPVTAFATAQILGWPLALPLRHRGAAEWALGAIGGLYGGVSGIWGPPLLVYLLSIKADKAETVRVQGVVFLLGAGVLMLSHLGTGVLNAKTLGFSAALTVAAQIGQIAGNRLQDRLDPVAFRRWTQALLILTGLNLLRQGLIG